MCFFCENTDSNLEEFKNLKFLNCSSCFNLTIIPEKFILLKSLTTLDLTNCTSLISIPNFKNLKLLNINSCKELVSIPLFPELEQLYCSYCIKLESLSEYENQNGVDTTQNKLTLLNCEKCISLKNIKINSLITLRCGYCNFDSVDFMTLLESLFCNNCSNLKSITNKKLKILSCYQCNLLTTISCEKLKECICEKCNMLTFIKFPNNMNLLKISECKWLEYHNLNFNYNILKLKIIQKFCRNNFKYFLFNRYTKSKEFIEWIYSPKRIGGKIEKRNIYLTIRDIK